MHSIHLYRSWSKEQRVHISKQLVSLLLDQEEIPRRCRQFPDIFLNFVVVTKLYTCFNLKFESEKKVIQARFADLYPITGCQACNVTNYRAPAGVAQM